MANRNIIFCGLPASGKTSIGKLIAQKMLREHIDTDDLIVKDYKSTSIFNCKQIYLKEGEEFFRRKEREQILTLLNKEKCVISIGGGSLSSFDNDKTLKKIGYLVYLKTDLTLLWQRLQSRGLPSYLNAQSPQTDFEIKMQTRQKKLETSADLIIDTTHLNLQEIASDFLLKWDRQFGQ